jgi:hypothetical protein
MGSDDEFGLDVLDYILSYIGEFVDRYEYPREPAEELQAILHQGGSAWEVAPRQDDGEFQLVRRAVGPVRDAIEDMPASNRAHQHLVSAWNHLSGRHPDPSSAYREAIRAVEAAAKPVILPTNARATLGTMIAAMRDEPGKWRATLGTVDDVRRMMEQVWTNQLDRHGTDDESVPLNGTLDQADGAFHICLALARMFAGGHVRPA